MVFVPPSWFMGMLMTVGFIVLGIIPGLIITWFAFKSNSDWGEILLIIGFGVIIAGAFVSVPLMTYEFMEAPSVQEKIITVEDWQPRVGVMSDGGVMTINSADDLMLVTTDGEVFYNTEKFLFGKWDTRDVFMQLKPGGVYKIQYYGWREGFNDGFPNLLKVVEVIDESNCTGESNSHYFGSRLSS